VATSATFCGYLTSPSWSLRTIVGMQSSVTVMDGGMGKELLRIGAPFRQPEWSALALLENPDAVRQAHQNFVNAGAEVIITNTYAVVPYHIGAERFAERAAELAGLAAEIARQVAASADHHVQVAGSLPPLFGSYEPWNFKPEEAPALWDVLVKAQSGKVDFWLAETVSSLAEYRVVAASVGDRPEPLWVSFTLTDDVPDDVDPSTWAQLRSGESIAEMADAVRGQVDAVLFNCSQPERFAPAIAALAQALGDSSIAIGAYANAFEDKEEGYASNDVVLGHRADLTPPVYARLAKDWIDAGASIVGGCCGIRPDHIEALTSL